MQSFEARVIAALVNINNNLRLNLDFSRQTQNTVIQTRNISTDTRNITYCIDNVDLTDVQRALEIIRYATEALARDLGLFRNDERQHFYEMNQSLTNLSVTLSDRLKNLELEILTSRENSIFRSLRGSKKRMPATRFELVTFRV